MFAPRFCAGGSRRNLAGACLRLLSNSLLGGAGICSTLPSIVCRGCVATHGRCVGVGVGEDVDTATLVGALGIC